MARPYTDRENRLLAEFLAERFPKRPFMLNVRVGDLAPDIKARFQDQPQVLQTYRAGLPRADALVFDNGTVWIVEAKLEAEQRGAAQLTTYKMLLPKTPELAEKLQGRTTRTLLVLARESVTIRALCAELGHEVAVFQPPWAAEYLISRGRTRISFP